MTITTLSSATREVKIGFNQPFVIIGERINPTGRKILAEEMKLGDYSRVEADALAQVLAGAQMLDVNAGIPLADEPRILAEAIQLVQSITDVPISIDSSIIEALEAGLSVYQGKALVNSVTGEDEVLERVLPLVKKYGAAVYPSDDKINFEITYNKYDVFKKLFKYISGANSSSKKIEMTLPVTQIKKDNSKKTDYFINCRSCKQYIRGDFRSNSDNRYCQDCL